MSTGHWTCRSRPRNCGSAEVGPAVALRESVRDVAKTNTERKRTATMTSTKRSPLTIKIAGFVALTLASVGGTRIASAKNANGERGVVEARGPVAKVVAAGPIALHAYSQFAGGTLYAAQAVTGTDSDCKGSSAGTSVEADRVATFAVGEGQVAC